MANLSIQTDPFTGRPVITDGSGHGTETGCVDRHLHRQTCDRDRPLHRQACCREVHPHRRACLQKHTFAPSRAVHRPACGLRQWLRQSGAQRQLQTDTLLPQTVYEWLYELPLAGVHRVCVQEVACFACYDARAELAAGLELAAGVTKYRLWHGHVKPTSCQAQAVSLLAHLVYWFWAFCFITALSCHLLVYLDLISCSVCSVILSLCSK